jgi:hypothetical protein
MRALLAAVVVASAAAPLAAGSEIGPNQRFRGVVNGRLRNAVVFVACPGPVSDGRTGPVVAGQTLGVIRAFSGGGGYTGPFSQVYAWFVPADPGETPVQVSFVRYGVAETIPDTVLVPCAGAGQVEFSSCPYLAPCAAGWIPTYVTVQFVNVAA